MKPAHALAALALIVASAALSSHAGAFTPDALVDPGPVLAANDAAYRGLADAVAFGDHTLVRSSSAQRPNLSDLTWAELSSVIVGATTSDRLSSALGVHVADVVGLASDEEMVGPGARRVVAAMQHALAPSERAYEDAVGHPMGELAAAPTRNTHPRIPITVSVSTPRPATIAANDEALKPLANSPVGRTHRGISSAAFARRQIRTADAMVILTRTLVAEQGVRVGPDAAAILHVLERRGARVGRTAAETALRYASVHRAPQGELGRSVRYASLLTLAERAPAVVALVIAWVRGERVADPCPGAMHWGDAHRDRERAERAGWVRVRCTEPTANLFWREPRVIRGES